jgi:mono/diheme cytochrome c family protein
MRVLIPTLLLSLGVYACASSSAEPELARIDGAPSPGALAPSTSVSTGDAQAITLGTVQGVTVVGTSKGVLRATLLGDNTVAPVPVVASAGEPTAIGAATGFARRGDTGWFVVGENGLFLDASSGLVPSPFSASLSGKKVQSLDVTGAGATEALWFSGADGAFVRRKNALVTLAVSSGKVEAAVGIDDHRALLFGGGNAWEADVDTNALTRVATGVAPVRGFDRESDGTVYVATDAGLLVRAPKGDLRVRTFSAQGQPPRAVSAVSVGLGGVAAIAGSDVVVVDDRGATVVGTASAAGSKLAFDANGDLWLAAGGALTRLAAGKPVSFERDVKPFMSQRCQSCHASGAGGAPARAFDTYEVAKAAAPEIVKRLRAENRPVMPPPSMGILSPADYRVVVRWALTGTPL